MKHKKLMFSQSVAYKWIVSYAVIMLIPLVVSAIIYLQTKQIVEYEIERAGHAMLKQMQNTVDSEINQAEKLAMQLSIHNDVNKYLNLTPGEEGTQAFEIYKTRQELSKYKSTNDFVSRIYLYSSLLDKVLTDETYTDSKTFYEINRQMIGLSYEDWLSALKGDAEKGKDALPLIEFKRWGTNVVLMKPFSNAGGEHTLRGTLILPLNGSKIQNMLKNVDWVNNGDVYIVDRNHQILFQNNSMAGLESMPWAEEGGEGAGTSFIDIAGTENMVSFIASDTTDWKYISVFPSSIFWEKAREIRNLNLIGLLLCFFIGGGVISYFARKNYNPVRELVNLFSGAKDEQSRRVLDEFAFI
ncbi:AraC family transcriptional regulator, partial [Paenibacillus riograndensis]